MRLNLFSATASNSDKFEVAKQSIFTPFDRAFFTVLTFLLIYSLANYTVWWFNGNHIPSNWGGMLHSLDILIFSVLSFIVFIGSTQLLGSIFTTWFASKPVHVKPQEGLRVAFLTCFVPGKEPVEMLEKTLKAMIRVKYPHDTWVLDEGASDEVKKLCKSLGVKYFTRHGIAKYNQDFGEFRAKTKAGNHNAWRDNHEDEYDIIAQIDMDNIPSVDYFEKTLGYFKDEKVGFICMPQYYKNTKNWIARGSAEQSYFFHGPMQQGFYGADMPFLIGTSHVYRAKAMNQIGGYAPTIVEDHLTGMKFYENGWKAVYVPEVLVRGEGPVNWVDYFNQQMRWSFGLFEILFKHTPKVIWKMKNHHKFNYLWAQLYYFTGVAVALGMVLLFGYLMFGIRSASMHLTEWLAYSTPPFVMALAIHFYSHKFSINSKKEPVFGLLGMFLNLGANLIYAVAFIKFLTGSKLKYMVTQKGSAGEKQSVPLSTFKLHMIFGGLMLAALIGSFFTNHSAIQLRFWAAFSALSLGAVAFSIYTEKVLNHLAYVGEAIRVDTRPVRYALGAFFGLMVFSATILGYTAFGPKAVAYVNKQVIAEFDNTVAGKIAVPTNGAYLGISLGQDESSDTLSNTQENLGKKFAVVNYYQSWGVDNNKFNKGWAKSIALQNAVPMITWEPWMPITGYDRSEEKVYQQEYLLKNIVDGKYDAYITEYAKDVRAYKRPVMIRFAHEMNGNWYPWGSTFNNPTDYVLAWRHVHEIFDSIGATNVTWVWSPNEAYSDLKVPYANDYDAFYPGDDYVDWVGFSAFNWAGIYKQNNWRDPQDLYSYSLKKLEKYNKPIMITETASAESGNPKDKALWIEKLADFVKANPQIKGLVWFNIEDNGVVWNVESSKESEKSFKENFDNYFISEL